MNGGEGMSKKEKAFALFAEGLKPSDPKVKALGLAAKTRYNYYQIFKHTKWSVPHDGGPSKHTGVWAESKIEQVPVLKETNVVSQTTFLKFVAKVQTIALTPPMYMSYMCAVKSGYPGTFGDWIEYVVEDFWTRRGRNPYEEIVRFEP
jgi:hypothetical protein